MLRRFALAITFITLMFGHIAGQSPGSADLITEFGPLPCGFILVQTDVLAAVLKRDPSTTAAIVIYRPTLRPTQAEKHRRLISSTLQLRGVGLHRFDFYLAEKSPDGSIRTAYWRLPAKSVPPMDGIVLWNESPLDVSRPFMFGFSEEIDICPTFVPSAFARLILDNPGSIGRIIVNVGKNSLVNRFWFAKRWLDELVERHAVSHKRLRLTFRSSKNDETSAEFWFVP